MSCCFLVPDDARAINHSCACSVCYSGLFTSLYVRRPARAMMTLPPKVPQNWADIENDDDDVEADGLVRHDAAGNRVITTYYREPDGRQMKCEKLMAVHKKYTKIPQVVKDRRRAFKQFGLAALSFESLANSVCFNPNPGVNEEIFRPPKRMGLLTNVQEDFMKAGEQPIEINKRHLADIQKLFDICLDPDVGSVLQRVQEKVTEIGLAAAAAAKLDQPQIHDARPMRGDADDRTIRVSNLADYVTSDELRKLCNRCGTVVRDFIVKHKETNISKGFAFVTFAHVDEAARAIKTLNGKGFMGAVLRVEWTKRRQLDTPAPFSRI